MKPDSSSGGDLPAQPRSDSDQSSRRAATNVIRAQIDALYGDRPTAERTTPEAPGRAPTPQTATTEDSNPYQRTYSTQPNPQADQWQNYHSAWQNYYESYYKQYYGTNRTAAQTGYFSNQTDLEKTTEILTKDEALVELRQSLLGKVKKSASKIRRSRHFVPIIAALVVVLLAVFIQYNRVLIATVNAYVSPGAINPQNIVIDPNADIAVSPEPRLIIPKINVDVPVLYDVGADHNSQMAAMAKGVAHFSIPGASSHPGEVGNTVISGHSSNDLFDPGDYKFIFAQLEKLKIGDTIYANYNSIRYTYVVTKMEVVKPTEVSKLIYPTNKPMLTLITCTPLGTAQDRLLVTAEQVSPDPAKAAQAPAGSGTTNGQDAALPGNSPTLFERLFGAR